MDITDFVVKDEKRTQRLANRWVYPGTYKRPDTKEELNVSIIAYIFPAPETIEDEEVPQFHLKRSERVAGICKQLPEHRNILKFYGTCAFDHIAHPTPLALVFARHSRGNLSKLLSENPEQTLDQRRAMMAGIAQGLLHLHANNIVHGNLCPPNIVIKDDGTPVLSEFGRSKWMTMTGQTTQSAGTAGYCSPEASTMGTKNLSTAADVYSFGMVSLFILSGKAPFYWFKNDVKVQYEIQGGGVPPRARYDGLVTDQHWKLLSSCWSFDARARPSLQAVFKDI